MVYKTKQRKVPNIWIDGKQIGGNSHIQEAYKNGDLKTWLESAGIQHSLKPYVESENKQEQPMSLKSFMPKKKEEQKKEEQVKK